MARPWTEEEKQALHDRIAAKLAPQAYLLTEADLRRLARMIAEEVDAMRRQSDKQRQREKRRMARVSPDEMLEELNVRF